MTRVVGVDVGGTKTHVMARSAGDAPTEDRREIVVASSSWRTGLGDFRADALGLRNLLVGELGDEVLRAPLAVGAHGCETTAHCDELERELRHHFSGPVVVVNDSELMAPAMGQDRAIGIVVGTGSIATGRSDVGELVTAGGWGWLLGDEGSAPALIRDAVRAVLAHLDAGGAADPLTNRLFASFAAQDAAHLALAVTDAASADSWGRHAPEVFAAANEGSPLADALIRDAGEHLGGLVAGLLDRGLRADTAVAGGSVIERQPLLQDALRAALARDCPGITLQILDKPPVTGAVGLALRLTHQTNDHR